MSTEFAAGSSQDLELRRAKRQGLRVALAIACGFSLGLTAGDTLPFLGPLFASLFLLANRSPMPLRQGLATVVLILVAGALLILCTGLLGQRPWVLLPLLWLFYFGCFWAQGCGKGGVAPALLLVIAIVVPMLDIHQSNLGESIVLILFKAVSGGMLLAWAAHALVPDLAGGRAEAVARIPENNSLATRQAMASASILLLILTICLVEPRLATAMVIPITVSSLLSQFDLNMTRRAAFGLILVNLLGGIVAALAFTLLELRPTLWLLFLIVLLVSLIFAGRAVSGTAGAKVFGAGLTTFLILFGLGVSPLPTSTPELFSTRIAYVVFAIVYALLMATLFWPKPAEPVSDHVG
jgi:hypothetical protein